tara:strand:+ start:1215 stop:1418 length:204 start_codon:yes stop_codon:yes gene_type:complete
MEKSLDSALLTDEQIAEIVYNLDEELHEVWWKAVCKVVGETHDMLTMQDIDRIKQGLAKELWPNIHS